MSGLGFVCEPCDLVGAEACAQAVLRLAEPGFELAV